MPYYIHRRKYNRYNRSCIPSSFVERSKNRGRKNIRERKLPLTQFNVTGRIYFYDCLTRSIFDFFSPDFPNIVFKNDLDLFYHFIL